MSATTLFGTLTGYREGRCNNEEFPSATLGKRPCNNKDFLLAKNNPDSINLQQMESDYRQMSADRAKMSASYKSAEKECQELQNLRNDYEHMQNMIFGEKANFDVILEGLAKLEKEINS